MNPAYRAAQFLTSAHRANQAPPDEGAEVAFAGRSNSGKSSAINAITGQSRLARTSKQPGRTQLLNFFALDEERRLVDLPGYGYAKVPLAIKQHWQKSMEEYLRHRRSLRGVILIMDVRHPLTDFDWQMLEWSAHRDLPMHVLLTKADKLKRGAAQNTLLAVRRELESPAISVQLFSSLRNIGIDEAHAQLDAWLGFEPLPDDGQKKGPG